MGAIYRFSRASHAQSTTADSATLNVGAGMKARLLAVEVTGGATAAAALAEFGVFYVTTLGSGGTPTTLMLKKVDSDNTPNPPTGVSAVFGYGTQPTIEADPVVRLTYQPLGGKARYTPAPGAEVVFGSRTAASQLSFRGISGTNNVAIDAVEFELI